ncbi:hypothetical protein [Arcobacter sp. YIC-310]|uniref:hypothetical protein n=1 Tax=Arcobacter sp. YIC-310 TaxID=3376632 RepID=UPI003C1ECA30
MIYDILEAFEKLYFEKKDKLILGSYSLKDGLYVKINKDNTLDFYEAKTIKKEKVFTDLNGIANSEIFEKFKQWDYYSSYLNSNKALFDKKIHNINYLSYFFKVENSEYVKEKIDDHFQILNDFSKFKSKEDKQVLEKYKEVLTKEERKEDILEKLKILKTLFSEIIKIAEEQDIKNYIRIFFDEDIEKYKSESEIYFALKIFNDSKYNQKIEDEIFGLSNANMGLNSKKPYLENKTKKLNIPFLIKNSDALILKKFFDWLKIQNYRDEKNIQKDRFLDEEHFFMQKQSKNDEAEIIDFDYIPLKSDDIKKQFKPIYVKNYLKVEKDKELISDYEIKELFILEKIVDELFYKKQLISNYYKDSKDIKVSEYLSKNLQNIVLTTRYEMNNFFRKYYKDEKSFYKHIEKYGRDFIFEYLKETDEKKIYFAKQKAKEALNLKLSLKKHYKGIEMDIERELENIRTLLTQDSYPALSKNEFLFLSAQWAYYLLSLSKADIKNKTFSFAERYFKAKDIKKIQDVLTVDLEKYKHAIGLNNTKAKKAIALIKSYESNEKLLLDDKDRFLVGFTVENVFYDKKKEEEN